MKIGIVSDSHDRADLLAQAVRAAGAEGASLIVHCGDLIGAQTLRPSMSMGIPIHVIHGNNLGDSVAMHALSRGSDGLVQYHGSDARLDFEGRKVFVVHYHDYGYAMACTGDWDLVCCGHSHEANIRRVSTVKGTQSWLINPGTVAGLAAPPTWALGDLDAMQYEIRALQA